MSVYEICPKFQIGSFKMTFLIRYKLSTLTYFKIVVRTYSKIDTCDTINDDEDVGISESRETIVQTNREHEKQHLKIKIKR